MYGKGQAILSLVPEKSQGVTSHTDATPPDPSALSATRFSVLKPSKNGLEMKRC